ncbi:MAG: type IV pilus assembly protein PilM [bacterium]|nr:type IV pilus assembly protein PilM [bacterium]
MSLLYKQFPPPAYLSMPSFGLDISDETLKFIKLEPFKGGFRIASFGKKTIPKGVIESGEVKKPEELASFLRDTCKPAGVRYVYLTLPEEKGYMNVVELPAMHTSEIRTALESQFSEYVPLPPEEAVFDFEVLHSKSSGKGKRQLEVAMISFPHALVDSYYHAVRDAGLMPLAFDAEVQALARAVIPRQERDPFLLIDFGKTRTTFIIVHERQVRFTSTVPVAGKDIDRIIAEKMSAPLSEAEQIKKENFNIAGSYDKKLFNEVLPILSAVRDELERYISFWETHAPGLHGGEKYGPIKKILLCGGDSNLIGLAEYLSHNIHIPVEHANVWANVVSFDEYIPEITFHESLMYGSAIGAALRSFDI